MASEKEKRFDNDPEYRIYRILHLAKKYSWKLTKSDEYKVEFAYKDGSILQIHYRNLKINTQVNHPKWGRTALTREGKLTHAIIESIFRNPRAHMPKNGQITSSYKSSSNEPSKK